MHNHGRRIKNRKCRRPLALLAWCLRWFSGCATALHVSSSLRRAPSPLAFYVTVGSGSTLVPRLGVPLVVGVTYTISADILQQAKHCHTHLRQAELLVYVQETGTKACEVFSADGHLPPHVGIHNAPGLPYSACLNNPNSALSPRPRLRQGFKTCLLLDLAHQRLV